MNEKQYVTLSDLITLRATRDLLYQFNDFYYDDNSNLHEELHTAKDTINSMIKDLESKVDEMANE